jgi:hypothetical protein
MIKARPKYPTNLYGNIYIDNIQKYVIICLIIPTIFPDAGSSFRLKKYIPGCMTYVVHPVAATLLIWHQTTITHSLEFSKKTLFDSKGRHGRDCEVYYTYVKGIRIRVIMFNATFIGG